jgi:soluble lytic murein transglycosylase-like protein
MLYDRFGVWETAFAAYNCGPSRVQGWIDEGKVTEDGRLSEIPISETANYVKKVAEAAENYEKLYYNK